MSDCLIIIPCYNEEERLPIKQFENFINLLTNSNIHLLFVNDGSLDNTQLVIDSLVNKNKEILFSIHKSKNEGKAAAIKTGSDWALEHSYQWIAYFDADLSAPLNEIFPMLKLKEDKSHLKFILGSRVKRLGTEIERSNVRHYFGRVFSTLASLVLKLPVYDTQCGAKLLHRDLIEIAFKEKFISKWIFDVEIIARIIQAKGKEYAINHLYEYPLQEWKEVGNSRLKAIHLLKVPVELLKIKIKY